MVLLKGAGLSLLTCFLVASEEKRVREQVKQVTVHVNSPFVFNICSVSNGAKAEALLKSEWLHNCYKLLVLA